MGPGDRARRGLAQLAQAAQVVGLGAVGEVDAGDIETGPAHLGKDIIIVGSRPEGRYDLGTALHGPIVGPEAAALNFPRFSRPLFRPTFQRAAAARDSSIATAGKVLPSTNSRKAPPPVEM